MKADSVHRFLGDQVCEGSSRGRGCPGFTLIELLVVIGIIALLAGMMGAGWSGAMGAAKRARCASNLRQLVMGSILYAADDRGGAYSAADDTGTRDVNYVLPYVAGGLGVFVCPSTRNRVERGSTESGAIADLVHLAPDWRSRGTSYLLAAFMGWKTPYYTDFPGTNGVKRVYAVLKTERSVQFYLHHNDLYGLKGLRPGPAQVFLLTDNVLAEVPYWPATVQNHPMGGANAGFLDGRVEWVSDRRFPYVFEVSEDDGRLRSESAW